MNYQLTNADIILCVDTGECIPIDASNSDYQAYLAWVAQGNVAEAPPVPTIPQLTVSLEEQVQAWLDQTAQSNGYADIDSCITYLYSSVSQWSADAKAALAWRDAVWQACYEAENNPTVQSNPPTAAQLIAELPQPSQFGWQIHAPGADVTQAPAPSTT